MERKKCPQKVAVITGASSGIGLCTAEKFVKEGYKVYGIARRECNCGFECISADVRDFAHTARILQEIYSREGRIDVFVNNAGIGVAGAIEEISAEGIKSSVDVNLTAVCVLSSQVIPYMKAGGKIINVSSVGGIIPLPYQAVYSATKAGVEVFSRAVANELKGRKIRVCAVLPGDTRTGFTAARVSEGTNERARRSDGKMARDEQRGKSPERVARVIYRLASRKRPPLRVCVGGVSKLEVFATRLCPTRIINGIVSKIYG